jgi:uncharacterized protein
MTATILRIKVKPNARESSLQQVSGGTSDANGTSDAMWVAKLKSLPIDGKANHELIGLVAEHFKCKKSAVSLKSGATARIKTVIIDA